MNLMVAKPVTTRAISASAAVDLLSYGTSKCALGEVLVARSSKGVCAVLIGKNAEELAAHIAERFPRSAIIVNEVAVRDDLTKIVRFIEKPAEGLHLTLDMRGPPFQRRVWEKLRAIPVGRTVTYTQLAKWVSPLASPRAVAAACAANPIALAVPCHRVIRANGELAGYRWGTDHK